MRHSSMWQWQHAWAGMSRCPPWTPWCPTWSSPWSQLQTDRSWCTNLSPSWSRLQASSWHVHHPHCHWVLQSYSESRMALWRMGPHAWASPGWGIWEDTLGTVEDCWRMWGIRASSARCSWSQNPWKGAGSWSACWSEEWCPWCPSDSLQYCLLPLPRSVCLWWWSDYSSDVSPYQRKGRVWTVWSGWVCQEWWHTQAGHCLCICQNTQEEHLGLPTDLK